MQSGHRLSLGEWIQFGMRAGMKGGMWSVTLMSIFSPLGRAIVHCVTLDVEHMSRYALDIRTVVHPYITLLLVKGNIVIIIHYIM